MFGGRVLRNESELVAACAALGATRVGGPLSPAEATLVRSAAGEAEPDEATLEKLRYAIGLGDDPLGEEFCTLRSPEERRPAGAFYTSQRIVRAMLAWILQSEPTRMVDTGSGSGRFTVEARRMGFAGELIAVDADPVATLMTRAHLAATGVTEAQVVHADFLRLRLPQHAGRTAFVGNPPYVRHHDLFPEAKRWAKEAGRRLGVRVSGLAGLHALFVLAAAGMSRAGDIGSFITAAEWLDVGYGSALRSLFAGPLGVRRLDLVDPRAVAFDDAMTTAAIASWEVGHAGSVAIRAVRTPEDLGILAGGRVVSRKRLAAESRWNALTQSAPVRNGLVPLATYARVHRGVATGDNAFFVIPRDEAVALSLEPYVRPCLVRAAQILSAGGIVRGSDTAYVLLDVQNDAAADAALRRYLAEGERRGVPKRYLCAHRNPWWRVGGAPPPPIVATYMARQPPVFAANPDGCQIVNVFHGIHFREPAGKAQARALVDWLNEHRDDIAGGRTYHGGLRKFEPRELEAVLVPPLERLAREQE